MSGEGEGEDEGEGEGEGLASEVHLYANGGGIHVVHLVHRSGKRGGSGGGGGGSGGGGSGGGGSGGGGGGGGGRRPSKSTGDKKSGTSQKPAASGVRKQKEVDGLPLANEAPGMLPTSSEPPPSWRPGGGPPPLEAGRKAAAASIAANLDYRPRRPSSGAPPVLPGASTTHGGKRPLTEAQKAAGVSDETTWCKCM